MSEYRQCECPYCEDDGDDCPNAGRIKTAYGWLCAECYDLLESFDLLEHGNDLIVVDPDGKRRIDSSAPVATSLIPNFLLPDSPASTSSR